MTGRLISAFHDYDWRLGDFTTSDRQFSIAYPESAIRARRRLNSGQLNAELIEDCAQASAVGVLNGPGSDLVILDSHLCFFNLDRKGLVCGGNDAHVHRSQRSEERRVGKECR